jgi:hypothetical protein
MIELIGDDRVFGAEQGFEETAIGIEAGRIKNRIFRPEERAETAFQLLKGISFFTERNSLFGPCGHRFTVGPGMEGVHLRGLRWAGSVEKKTSRGLNPVFGNWRKPSMTAHMGLKKQHQPTIQ